MDDVQQMVIVAGIDLDEHIIVARRVVAFHHLGDILQGFDHLIETFRMLQVQSHISTGFIADLLGIDNKLRAFQHTKVV